MNRLQTTMAARYSWPCPDSKQSKQTRADIPMLLKHYPPPQKNNSPVSQYKFTAVTQAGDENRCTDTPQTSSPADRASDMVLSSLDDA